MTAHPRLLAALALVWAALWFVLLDAHPLFNPDEGRYAEIPREMLASGHLLVPRLDGIVYIEKPPLQYWTTVASYRLFGVSEWSARLSVGVAGFLTVLIMFGFAHHVWGRAAAWRAGLMGGSMLLPVLMSHHITLDASLTLFTTASLAAFCVAQLEETNTSRRHRWMVLAWAAAALGVLTKGIVAVFLPAAALLMYSWFRRDGQVWRRLSPLRGVPVFLLIAAPWFVGMYRAVPGFLDFFFIREHLQRYLTPIAGRQQAWWFFLPVLVVGVLPWVPSAVRALATGWRASEPRAGFNVRGFLWCWVIVTFVFFSASDSKLVPYILPLFPALGLLMASADPASVRRDTLRTAWGLVAVGVLLALFAIVEPFLAQRFGWSAEVLSLRTWLMVMAAVLIAGGVVGTVVSGDPAFAHIAISAAAFASVGVLLWAARGLTPLYSGEPLVEALPPELRSAPTYAVHQYDQTVPFYLARTTTLVEERNELDFGLQLEPWREIDRWPEFEARWRRSGQALAILDQRDLRDLQRRGVPLQVRAYAGREVLVSRR